jgi:hypothetical protein
MIEGGSVAGVGTHEQLVENCASYRDLATKQNLVPSDPAALSLMDDSYVLYTAEKQ